MHTVASHRFDDVISFLAIGKHIEYRRHTARILNKGTDKQQVIGNTEKLTHHHTDGFSARRHRNPSKLFNRHDIR